MKKTAKFVNEIEVIDPDTNGVVHLAVYKHQNGGMFAIDSSFIEQVVDEDEGENAVIYDPFSDIEEPEELYLIE